MKQNKYIILFYFVLLDMIKRTDNYFDYYLNKLWKKKEIPPDKASITQFSLLDDKILHTKVKEIIHSNKFLNKIYNQYMSLRTDTYTTKFMYDLLKEIDTYTDTNKLFLFLMDYGMEQFISMNIMLNPLDDPSFTNNVQILFISPDSLSLPNKTYYTDPKNKNILEEFYKYQKKLIDKLNLSNSINSDIINEIENEIAKRSHTLDESRNYDIKLNKVSLDELIKKFNNIDFISIFKSYEKDTFFGNLKGMYDAGVYDKLIISYKINDTKETPFDYINLLFTDVEKTKMYVKWRIINGLSSLLSSEIVDIHYSIFKGIIRVNCY
jgi:predicted metalloendopeptidase